MAGDPELPDEATADARRRHRRIALTVAAVGAVLIAGVIGLLVGHAATPETVDPGTAREEAALATRDATLKEVRKRTALQGFREGRTQGTRQGRKAGRKAGRADGRLQARLEFVEAAESEAAAAQAELSAISKAPPTPTAGSGAAGR